MCEDRLAVDQDEGQSEQNCPGHGRGQLFTVVSYRRRRASTWQNTSLESCTRSCVISRSVCDVIVTAARSSLTLTTVIDHHYRYEEERVHGCDQLVLVDHHLGRRPMARVSIDPP